MGRRGLLVAAGVGVMALRAAMVCAAVPVEQIEALEQEGNETPDQASGYAPVNFNGSSTVAGSGQFAGITFHAASGLTDTLSSHASVVAGVFYGSSSVAYSFVSDVYNDDANDFFNTINPQAATGTGPIPGTFAGEAKVINNSYVADGSSATPVFSNVDALRRLDYMIASADTVFVTAAVSALPDPNGGTDYYTLNWSAYDSLAVSGAQTFDPSAIPGGPPGKTHADITAPDGDASYTTAHVSSDATALWGGAAAMGESSAEHDVVIRSLLMSGADKTTYTGPFTANHLSVANGAGTENYAASLGILQSGQRAISFNGNLSTISVGAANTSTRGWAYSTIEAGGNSYLTFHSNGEITGITASLNWDVTQAADTSAETIDTSDAGTIFPNVGLEVVPLTSLGNGVYAIGTQSDASLISVLPADTDNEQYLYFTGVLAAGDYAFEFIGDPTLAADVGFSYSISEVPEPICGGVGAILVGGWCVRRRARK